MTKKVVLVSESFVDPPDPTPDPDPDPAPFNLVSYCFVVTPGTGYLSGSEYVNFSSNLGDLNSPEYDYETPANYGSSSETDPSGFAFQPSFHFKTDYTNVTAVTFSCDAYDIPDGLPCLYAFWWPWIMCGTEDYYPWDELFDNTISLNGSSLEFSLNAAAIAFINNISDASQTVQLTILIGCVVDESDRDLISEKTGTMFLTNQKLTITINA